MKERTLTPEDLKRLDLLFRLFGFCVLGLVMLGGILVLPKAVQLRGRPLSITAEGSEHLFQFTCGALVTGVALAVLFLYVANLFRKVRGRHD